MKNEMIEALFYHFEEMDNIHNPMENEACRKAFDLFFKKYFGNMEHDEHEKALDELLELLGMTKRSAFETGFNACLEMVTK